MTFKKTFRQFATVLAGLAIFTTTNFSPLVMAEGELWDYDLVEQAVDTSKFYIKADRPVVDGEIFLEIGEEITFEAVMVDLDVALTEEDGLLKWPSFSQSDQLSCSNPGSFVVKCKAVKNGYAGDTRFNFYDRVKDKKQKIFYTDSIFITVGGRDSCINFKNNTFDELNSINRIKEDIDSFAAGGAFFKTQKHDDFCKDENILVKYLCEDGGMEETEFDCEAGCENGECQVKEGEDFPDFEAQGLKIVPFDCVKCGEKRSDIGKIIPAYAILAKIKNIGHSSGEGQKILKLDFSNGIESRVWKEYYDYYDCGFECLYGLRPREKYAKTMGENYPWAKLGWVKQTDLKDDDVLTVTIDPDNLVKELNEMNNSLSRTVAFAKAPERIFTSTLQNPFLDTNSETELGKAAIDLYSRGMISGYPDGNFGAGNPVNRAEIVKILMLMVLTNNNSEDGTFMFIPSVKGDTGFSDVSNKVWYAPFVVKAVESGIIDGYPDGTFHGEQTVNVAEFAKMLALALKLSVADGESNPWWQRYFDTLSQYELSFLDFDPAKELSRGEIAIGIYQYFQKRGA